MMKRYLVLIAIIVLLAGCGNDTGSATPTATPQAQRVCGDGICSGPENAANCPQDCEVTSTPEATPAAPPLYFFYAIHTHVSDQFLPYSDPGMTTIDADAADNMIAAIEGIAAVLDKYGVKATWELTEATARGISEYQGEDNVFKQLIADGHEIAVHAHKVADAAGAVQAVIDCCDITPTTTSGFEVQIDEAGLAEVQETASIAIETQVNLGLTASTINLWPDGSKNLLTIPCNDEFGTGNDMWQDTGNLMFPWRPDYISMNMCADNPAGEMVFVDHVSIEALILPGETGPSDVLDSRNFNLIKAQFDEALGYMEEEQPERAAVWGFVTHITEYAFGSDAQAPPSQSALDALDAFLFYVDSKHNQGLVNYATVSEIAELALE